MASEKSLDGFVKEKVVLSTIEPICELVRDLVRKLPNPGPSLGGGAVLGVGGGDVTLKEQ